jgi:hypothetical protein
MQEILIAACRCCLLTGSLLVFNLVLPMPLLTPYEKILLTKTIKPELKRMLLLMLQFSLMLRLYKKILIMLALVLIKINLLLKMIRLDGKGMLLLLALVFLLVLLVVVKLNTTRLKLTRMSSCILPLASI